MHELSGAAQRAPARLFFGGSFDPPHIGHARLPALIAAQLDDARVIYVPAARSPLKSTDPVADHHRVNMLRIALDQSSDWDIWEQELDDGAMNPDQPSYWADTWAIVSRMGFDGINRFLIGADQAVSMHRWHRYTEFWKDAIVMLRDDAASSQALIDQLAALGVWSDEDLSHWSEQIMVVPMIESSSSSIRETLADPLTRHTTIEGLDPGVEAYIIEHDLYE